ncbi:MAG: hypothetical protein ACLPHI_02610 [Terriglobales bacterium]
MLKLMPTQLIAGLTVYGDDSDPTVFYVMPNEPSFRPDPANPNNYILKFIKYVMPVDRPDGSVGGGFLIFDSVFVIPEAQLNTIQTKLNQQINAGGKNSATAKIGLPPFIPTATSSTVGVSPTATVTLLDSGSGSSAGGTLVQKIESPGKPSLSGSMVCSFTAELSPEGAAVVEGALAPPAGASSQQATGGIVQIAYNLSFMAVLPNITGRVWFNADKFASYYQTIQKSGGSWDSGNNTENETMREAFISSDSGGVTFDFSGLDPNDPSSSTLQTSLTNWGWQQLNVAVQNVLGASGSSSQSGSSTDGSSGNGTQGTSSSGSSGSGSSGSSSSSGGVTGQNTGGDLGSDRGDDGMDNVTRNESSFSMFSFDESFNEKQSILMNTTQQGTLPNIPNFSAYAVTINANDPFFAQVHASVNVDADFAKFSIQSVDVNLTYDEGTAQNPPIPATVGGHHFTTPDDVFKFDSDTVNGNMSYKYSYNVNYMDQSAPYKVAQQSTTSPVLTLDVGSMGILYVDITVTNVDFTKTPTVLVAIQYPDPDATGAAINRQFSFNSTTTNASLLVVIMKPFNKQYTYQVTYVMADGTQLVRPSQSDSTQELFIKSPFSQQTVSFIAEGDFTNEINNIFLKMTYVDTANNYQQTTDYTFTSANRSHDWSFPIIAGGQGMIHFSGVVSNNNNTTENIPDTTSTSNLITFGPPNQAIITVTADASLLDFTKVQLVQVNFSYSDPANNIALNQEVVLKSTGSTPPSWTFYVKDPTKTAYTYQATYYMVGNPPTQVQQPPATSSATDLILTMPVAAAA